MQAASSQTNGKSVTVKQVFRISYSVTIRIQAKPEQLWAILTSYGDYPRWNSTVKQAQGKIAVGEKIRLVVHANPGRIFTLTVTKLLPPHQMVWESGFAPMFKGVRTYTLTPQSGTATDFTMTEVLKGLMLPMISGSLPDLGSSFEQFAADLKREAERKSS